MRILALLKSFVSAFKEASSSGDYVPLVSYPGLMATFQHNPDLMKGLRIDGRSGDFLIHKDDVAVFDRRSKEYQADRTHGDKFHISYYQKMMTA